MAALPEWSLSPMAADPRYRLLKQISRVLRGRSLYPTGHPQLKEAVTEMTQSLPGLFDGRPEIRIVVSDDRLFVDDVRNAEMEMVAHDFKAKLKAQGVELVVLMPGLTSEELLAFAEGLLTGRASGLPHIQMGKLNMGVGPSLEAAGPRHDFSGEVLLLRQVFEGWTRSRLVTDHVERIMRVIEENLFAIYRPSCHSPP
jgi:hypothetical protein